MSTSPVEPPTPPESTEAPPLPYARTASPPRIGLAIASLVLGIIGLALWPFGLMGLILGIVALVLSEKEPTRYGGRWLAIGGIVTGSLCLVMLASNMVERARSRVLLERAFETVGLQAIGQAAQVYARNHADAFPPDLDTLFSSGSLNPEVLRNWNSGRALEDYDYYYVAGLNAKDDPRWVLAYSDPQFRKGEGANILFVDGHVELFNEPTFSAAIAQFKQHYERARGALPTIIPPK
jgi:prepilin-type processing-associated H-X9-DG protein